MAIFNKVVLKITAVLIFLLPLSCFAQFSISGRVINNDDNKPVVNASVFLSNATIGGKTTDAGAFILRNIKPGKYELVVSIVGFNAYHQILMVSNSNIVLPDILLSPKTTALKGVSITVDHNRDRNLEWFEDEFLGTSALARQCRILNSEILDLEYDEGTNTLTASSDDFLVIENKALGYKVNYLLSDFKLVNKIGNVKEIHYDGSVLFTEMKGTKEQKENWEKARQEVYQNSAMHFLRSLISDKIEEEGFRVTQISITPNPERPPENVINTKILIFKDPDSKAPNKRDSLAYWIKKSKLQKVFQKLMRLPLTREEILKPTNQHGIYMFGCDNDALYVNYNKAKHFHLYNNYNRLDATNTETTVISFAKPFTLIDGNGGIINSNDVAYDGVWAQKRVADLLPLNYEPPQNPEAIVDSTVSKNVNAKLKSFSADHVTEKAYLHFDKPYYAAGDTIYFKAYVTTGADHRLSNLSGILNVDLINTNNKIDQSIKLMLNNGVAWGDFALPDSLSKGNYQVRAYTQLMRNDGEKDFFDQTIPVASVKKSQVPESIAKQPLQDVNNKPDMQFFPEGGSLVAGVRSKVAFKAIGGNGLGINVKGVVVDNDNKEIGSFTSAHLGMGYFYTDAAEGKTFKARLTYGDGTQNVVDLPKTEAKGIVLSVDNDVPSKITLKIQASKVAYQENRDKDYTLLIYSGGSTTNYICKLTGPSVSIDIVKGDYPSGVARVTLFSPTGEPLSERLLFIKNADQLNLGVSSDKKAYSQREKVNIKLNATRSTSNPATGHFSVSVIDESQIPANENNESTILSDLLLTSDLKGYVEQPNYYFASNNAAADLDVLMLTQGYRKFEWKQVLDNKTPPVMAYQPEKTLDLAGILKTASGVPVPKGEVTLISPADNLMKDTTTDIDGNFKFTDLYLTGNPTLVLRARKENKSGNVKIELKQAGDPAVAKAISPGQGDAGIPTQVAALMQQKYYELATGGIKLKEVKIKSYKPSTRPELVHSANLNGPGNANYIIMSDQLVGCMDFDCLRGKIPGIWKDGVLYSRRTGARLGQNQGFPPPPMAVIIDGVLLYQSSKPFELINITDINSIEVLESVSYLTIYGSEAPGGALIITTKRGGEKRDVSVPSANGLIRFPFRGYYRAREFYSPKYDHPELNMKQKDLRSTIFWKPELLTDKDGNASFEYYNADGKGTYRLVIEGIDNAGNIGRQVYRYKVE